MITLFLLLAAQNLTCEYSPTNNTMIVAIGAGAGGLILILLIIIVILGVLLCQAKRYYSY